MTPSRRPDSMDDNEAYLYVSECGFVPGAAPIHGPEAEPDDRAQPDAAAEDSPDDPVKCPSRMGSDS